jgi:hypothetical protein
MIRLYDEYLKIDDLEQYIKIHDLELTEEEFEILDTWKDNELTIVAFETEQDGVKYLKEYTVNNWMLQYYKTEFLADNVKAEFNTIDFETRCLIIRALQDQDNADTTNNLLQIVDIDDLIYDAINIDGLGHLLNHYDGKDFEPISKKLNSFITITAI